MQQVDSALILHFLVDIYRRTSLPDCDLPYKDGTSTPILADLDAAELGEQFKISNLLLDDFGCANCD